MFFIISQCIIFNISDLSVSIIYLHIHFQLPNNFSKLSTSVTQCLFSACASLNKNILCAQSVSIYYQCQNSWVFVRIHGCQNSCSVAQSWPTLCEHVACSLAGSLYSWWDSLGKNTEVGCHPLLQGSFPAQGSSLHLLHWQVDSFITEPPGKARLVFIIMYKTLS